MSRDVLERGGERRGGLKGEGALAGTPPPPRVPLWSPAEGGPRILKLQSSWHRRRRGTILAVSLQHRKGRRRGGRGGTPPPPADVPRPAWHPRRPLPPPPRPMPLTTDAGHWRAAGPAVRSEPQTVPFFPQFRGTQTTSSSNTSVARSVKPVPHPSERPGPSTEACPDWPALPPLNATPQEGARGHQRDTCCFRLGLVAAMARVASAAGCTCWLAGRFLTRVAESALRLPGQTQPQCARRSCALPAQEMSRVLGLPPVHRFEASFGDRLPTTVTKLPEGCRALTHCNSVTVLSLGFRQLDSNASGLPANHHRRLGRRRKGVM